MYQHILVPLDGSSNANEALREAISLAKNWQAKLLVLHVTDVSQFMGYGPGVAFTDVVSSLRANGENLIQQAKQVVENAGITVTPLNKEGSPKQQITEIANDPANLVDLIVIGKSGTNSFSRMVVGSTTNYVVQHADPNVLVVNDVPDPE